MEQKPTDLLSFLKPSRALILGFAEGIMERFWFHASALSLASVVSAAPADRYGCSKFILGGIHEAIKMPMSAFGT